MKHFKKLTSSILALTLFAGSVASLTCSAEGPTFLTNGVPVSNLYGDPNPYCNYVGNANNINSYNNGNETNPCQEESDKYTSMSMDETSNQFSVRYPDLPEISQVNRNSESEKKEMVEQYYSYIKELEKIEKSVDNKFKKKDFKNAFEKLKALKEKMSKEERGILSDHIKQTKRHLIDRQNEAIDASWGVGFLTSSLFSVVVLLVTYTFFR